MILQITGNAYASFNPLIRTIHIPLEEPYKLEVEHYGEVTIIRIRGEEYYLETSSIIYQLI
jgi:hypothetical protein